MGSEKKTKRQETLTVEMTRTEVAELVEKFESHQTPLTIMEAKFVERMKGKLEVTGSKRVKAIRQAADLFDLNPDICNMVSGLPGNDIAGALRALSDTEEAC